MPYKDINKARQCNRASYARNARKRKARIVQYKQECIAQIRKIKESSPCSDCGIFYPYFVMDFDHRENKKFNIGGSLYRNGWKNILREIAKCDLVCANCHRIRTHGPVIQRNQDSTLRK